MLTCFDLLERGMLGKAVVEAPSETDVEAIGYTSAKGTKDQPNHLKSMLVLSRVSLGITGAEKLHQVARMIKGNRQWLLSVNLGCKC